MSMKCWLRTMTKEVYDGTVLVFRKSSLDETVKHVDEVRKQVAKRKFKLRRKIAKGTVKASEVPLTI